jgi:hypothetical protein
MSIFLNAKIKSVPSKSDWVERKSKEGELYLKDGKIKFRRTITPKRMVTPMIFIKNG